MRARRLRPHVKNCRAHTHASSSTTAPGIGFRLCFEGSSDQKRSAGPSQVRLNSFSVLFAFVESSRRPQRVTVTFVVPSTVNRHLVQMLAVATIAPHFRSISCSYTDHPFLRSLALLLMMPLKASAHALPPAHSSSHASCFLPTSRPSAAEVAGCRCCRGVPAVLRHCCTQRSSLSRSSTAAAQQHSQAPLSPKSVLSCLPSANLTSYDRTKAPV